MKTLREHFIHSPKCQCPECQPKCMCPACNSACNLTFMHSQCHPKSPMWIAVNKAAHLMVITCAKCGKPVAQLHGTP